MDKAKPENQKLYRNFKKCCYESDMGCYDCISATFLHKISDEISVINTGVYKNNQSYVISKSSFNGFVIATIQGYLENQRKYQLKSTEISHLIFTGH